MPNTTRARPYTDDELTAVRPIIELYNDPDSPAPRLLATLDAVATDVRLLRDEIADLRAAIQR